MRKVHAQHGRDHHPNGSDPIPGVGMVWPTRYDMVGVGLGGYTSHSGGGLVGDSAAPGGVYWQSTSNNDFLVYDIHLGPYLSHWDINVLYGKGSDYGIIKVQLASWSTGPGGPPVSGGGPDSYVTVLTIDAYAASPSYVVDLSAATSNTQIIQGADFDALTTYSTPNFDGGSGPYRMRIIVDGKNASSSGYRARLLACVVQRDVESGGAWPP